MPGPNTRELPSQLDKRLNVSLFHYTAVFLPGEVIGSPRKEVMLVFALSGVLVADSTGVVAADTQEA